MARPARIAATTKQVPRPTLSRPLADPPRRQAAANTVLPTRWNRASSTTTRARSPSPASRAAISRASRAPTSSRLHLARENNRRAR
jgi:hypothetical protein